MNISPSTPQKGDMNIFKKKTKEEAQNIEAPPPLLLSELKSCQTAPCQMHTASLAFLGDAVYSLMVRERLANQYGRAEDMHSQSINYVSARAQSEGARKILPFLTEKELAVFKRGRNMHTANRPKGATEAEYHNATAIETLFGYLYLSGDFQRMQCIFELSIS